MVKNQTFPQEKKQKSSVQVRSGTIWGNKMAKNFKTGVEKADKVY